MPANNAFYYRHNLYTFIKFKEEIRMAETITKKYLDLEGTKSFKTLLLAAAQEIADKVKTDIVDGAPEAFDTLKEVSDYIATHKNEYDALVALVGDKAAKTELTSAVERIVALEGSVTTLKADENTEGSVKATAKGYAGAAQTAAENKVTELKNGAVKTNTDAIATLNGEETAEGSVKKIAKGYADTVDAKVTTLNGEEATTGSVKNIAKGYADAVDTKVTTLSGTVDTVSGKVDTNTSDITALKTKVADLESVAIEAISTDEINALFTKVTE